MGLLCEYFAAPSDDAAATTIDWTRGPRRPPAAKRGWLKRGAEEVPGFPSVSIDGVEPIVKMGMLEEILTGGALPDILEETSTADVAVRDGGERLVIRLTKSLQDALAAKQADELGRAAETWSRTEEFWGQGDPEFLAERLTELAELARVANKTGKRLCCWLVV